MFVIQKMCCLLFVIFRNCLLIRLVLQSNRVVSFHVARTKACSFRRRQLLILPLDPQLFITHFCFIRRKTYNITTFGQITSHHFILNIITWLTLLKLSIQIRIFICGDEIVLLEVITFLLCFWILQLIHIKFHFRRNRLLKVKWWTSLVLFHGIFFCFFRSNN